MTLKLNGSSSGYTAINAPAAAGSNTLVLPTNNGTAGQVLSTDGNGALSWVDKDAAARYFYSWRNDGSNQTITSNTITKVEYDSTRQSHSAFSTTDNKWTATADDAGAWLFISQISFYTDGNDGNNCFVKIYKNNAQVAGGYNWIWRGTNDIGHFVGHIQTLEVIASGDYIESYGRIEGGGTEAFFGGDSSGGHKQTSLVGFKL